MEHDIQHSGGARLKRLPDLIAREEQFAQSKREKRLVLEAKLRDVGIETPINSAEQMEKALGLTLQTRHTITAQRNTAIETLEQQSYELGTLKRSLRVDTEELDSLQRRKGNLPDAFIEIRSDLCETFRISPSDLPFVAELVAVDPQHSQWEASVEQVLHSFARTLLVPDDLYSRVSGFIDSERLVDSRGRGLRLSYDRVAAGAKVTTTSSDRLALP